MGEALRNRRADLGEMRAADEHARSPREEVVHQRGPAQRADAASRGLLAKDVADRGCLLADEPAHPVDDDVPPVDVLSERPCRDVRHARWDRDQDSRARAAISR